MQELKETHTQGFMSVDNSMESNLDCDFGIQIAKDGRVWIFIRFKPASKTDKEKRDGG